MFLRLLLPFILAHVLGFFDDVTLQRAIDLRSFGAGVQVEGRIEREELEEVAVSPSGRARAAVTSLAEVIRAAGDGSRRSITFFERVYRCGTLCSSQ